MIIKIGEPPKRWHEIYWKGKENILNINNNKNPIVKQEDTFGNGDDCMISKLKIGKITFIVASYFYNLLLKNWASKDDSLRGGVFY